MILDEFRYCRREIWMRGKQPLEKSVLPQPPSSGPRPYLSKLSAETLTRSHAR